MYVDGFNLYYGKLRGRGALKWLDLESLGRTLVLGKELVKVRYFTAWISGKTDQASQHRQQTYVRSLRSLPLVETHFGHFETRPKDRPLYEPIPGLPRTVRILHTEEKGSDVNLATWLLLDGVDGVYDEAIVITNDSDLEEPIRRGEHPVRPRPHRQPLRTHQATTSHPYLHAGARSGELPLVGRHRGRVVAVPRDRQVADREDRPPARRLAVVHLRPFGPSVAGASGAEA